MRVSLLLGAVVVAAAAGGGYWYWQQRPAAAPAAQAAAFPPAPVEAAAVTVGKVVLSIPAVGSLRSNESVVIAPEISGRVDQIAAQEGRKVAAGTPVARLDQSIYRAEIDQAQASLALSQANFARAKELLAKKVGTVRTRDEALASLRADEAALALAQARLDKTVLTAPFEGILGLRRMSVGQYVDAGTPIINLEDVDPLKVDFRVPEIYFPQVKVGQTIQLSVDALPGERFPGEVYAIDPAIDENGRSIVIRARVPNADDRLRPGLFVRITLIYAVRDHAILVPEQALVPVGERKFVYRVVDGKAVRTEVRIGERVDAQVEVVEGLKPGDMVVTAGQLKVRDGAPVAIQQPETTS